jgi:hypothetical protein
MDIYLSGDMRKDKRVDGYVLNTNHYPNTFNIITGGTFTTGNRYNNIIVDSFDYSSNFIERKSTFFDKGAGSEGIIVNWGDIGYSYNVYISGNTYTNFSGITTNNNSYTAITKSYTMQGLPDYTGLTVTTATTLSGNVLIKVSSATTISATTLLLQYNVSNNADFIMDVFKYNSRVIRVNTPGTYNHILDISGITSTNLWLDFFIKSEDEVRLNNIKLFSIQ